jgi:hypothetical protein
MFSAYERKQLRLIEQWFEQDDPELAKALRGDPTHRRSPVPYSVVTVLACTLVALGVVTANFLLLFAAALTSSVAACMFLAHKGERNR